MPAPSSTYTPYTFTTLAGRAEASGSANGTGSAARFNSPEGVAVDSAGNLYVTDEGNQTIRKVTPTGVVTTLAGSAGTSGSADGTNGAARFNFVSDPGLTSLAVDSAGSVYVSDYGTIRKVTPVGTNWVVTTLAGRPGLSGNADGTGSNALFNGPGGVAMDSAGNLYVLDQSNNTIRKGFPASSVPAPVLEPPSLIAGQFGFGVTGLPNLAVNIESSADLSNWKVLTPYITLVGGTNYYVSPNPPQGVLFYRAQVR